MKRRAKQVKVKTNLGRVMRFRLDGMVLERRLVGRLIRDMEQELNVASPVGRALLTAQLGAPVEVEAPGGSVLVEVLEIWAEQGGM